MKYDCTTGWSTSTRSEEQIWRPSYASFASWEWPRGVWTKLHGNQPRNRNCMATWHMAIPSSKSKIVDFPLTSISHIHTPSTLACNAMYPLQTYTWHRHKCLVSRRCAHNEHLSYNFVQIYIDQSSQDHLYKNKPCYWQQNVVYLPYGLKLVAWSQSLVQSNEMVESKVDNAFNQV